jgi:diamine N-acetyltransferase
MMDKFRVYLRTPMFEELVYRRTLLADSATMSYNKGFDEYDGYDTKTGCIDFHEDSWNSWYTKWIDNMPERYYAYIIKNDENVPIGEVALRYVADRKAYCVNIIVDSKYRGNGFSEEALQLLIHKAFDELKVNILFDDFPKSRISAERVFAKLGFRRISGDIIELAKYDYIRLFNEGVYQARL